MRLTTKGRFAVMAMVDLTLNGGKGPVTLASISERQKISLSYLEQLFGKLRKHDIVESVRGPGGGYYLGRQGAAKISIADIIVAVDEPLDATKCGGQGNCHDEQQCLTHDLWMGLNETIYGYLAAINLQQLVESKKSATSNVITVMLDRKAKRPVLTSV
jgi:Rrf2 family transcriptional regulator, iron-sulfur cluster assembly transcription factor